jgi:DNA segregation ATPase FtsK/SpoIIIE, S-DNA-T family
MPLGDSARGAHAIKESTADSFIHDVIGESRRMPVLVEFWAADPYLGPASSIIDDKLAHETDGRARFVRLDINKYPEIAKQLRVSLFPTLLAFYDSKPVDVLAGRVSPSLLLDFVDRVIRNHGDQSASASGSPTGVVNGEHAPDFPGVRDTSAIHRPAARLRDIAEHINNEISKKAQAELSEIDRERKQANDRASELLDGLQEAADGTRRWLKNYTDHKCDSESDVESTSIHKVSLSTALRDTFGDPFSPLTLGNVFEAWRAYEIIPRVSRYNTLKKYNVGFIIGLVFVSVVFAAAVLNRRLDFSLLFFGAIVIAVCGILVVRQLKLKHRAKIEAAYAPAHQLSARALVDLGTVTTRLRSVIEQEQAAAINRLDGQEANLAQRYTQQMRGAARAIEPIVESIGALGAGFQSDLWGAPSRTAMVAPFIRIGALSWPATILELDRRLRPHGRLSNVPALLDFAPGRGICLLGDGGNKNQMIGAAQAFALRFVAGIPPGKLRFTFIDPVGLGQNVAPLLALGDHAEELVGGRAWSEPAHIEQRLAEITQHMETVIQKYLRDEHGTIETYNEQAGQVVEAYRLLIICDFPVNFTETSARRLVSIAQNGPRCGVYPIVVIDQAKPMPYGVDLPPLLAHLSQISRNDGLARWPESRFDSWPLALDAAPPQSIARSIINSHGELAESGMHVSVPFSDLVGYARLKSPSWGDKVIEKSAEELVVPLGPSGARKYQDLMFGRGTAHHALIVGQTGSGKSNLLHVLITMLALKYTPDELELYLIDFKQGVEFKIYADAGLPHAKVIAIQSEREFGLSVLRGLLAEMNRRGDLFRASGVPGLADWRRRSGASMSRILLLVDEFRVFFTADDSISTEAMVILDRLVSQGRAFGIHVVLASQTLAGSYALPRSITDQMAIRIVLQCTEADSRLALADDNPEARLLSRPGEAIYNDQRGLIEGNHRFQVADMGSDDARAEVLQTLLAPKIAAWRGTVRPPIVFEGHLPSRLEEGVPLLSALTAARWPQGSHHLDIWLGEPIAIAPPTSIRLLRQGGANLLFVMRDEAQAVLLIQAALLAIAAQLRPADVGFHIVDLSSVDAPWAGDLARLTAALPHEINLVARRGLRAVIENVGRELDRRLAEERAPTESIIIVLNGLHRMHDLREEEGASWGEPSDARELRRIFAKLLREGPEVGIHTLIWTDSQASAARVLDRRMLNDIGRRIVGAMSEQDSLALIDEPVAGRLDKPHRLVRFDEDRPGELQIFRPYAVSDGDWFVSRAKELAARAS